MATTDYTPSGIKRFWSKVDTSGGMFACWLWTAYRNRDGYGVIGFGRGILKLAHRASWEIAHGEIPNNLWVLHRCDNPACVNPSHLWLGTVLDNNRDRDQKGRATHLSGDSHWTHINPDGVRKGEKVPNSKLTSDQVREIRRRYPLGGISQRKLAKEFGITQSTLRAILTRKWWKHVE